MKQDHIALMFSKQVDSVMTGTVPPDTDPLLSLAAELSQTPDLNPTPAFTQRLRHQLLAMWDQKHAVIPPRQWSFAGATLALLLILTLTLVWSPRTLSASEVLARAAEAVAVTPGQIVHFVSEVHVKTNTVQPPQNLYGAITEYWVRTGTTSEGQMTSVEVVSTVYLTDDVSLSQPLRHYYSTPNQLCSYSPTHTLALTITQNQINCAPLDTRGPDPMAIYAGESFQDWIDRLRRNLTDIAVTETLFNGRPAYNLTYRESGHQAQFPIAVTPTAFVVTQEGDLMARAIVTDITTLYIDRETYLPIGVISQDPDTNVIFTHHISDYHVIDPHTLNFDPFIWPPQPEAH